MQQLRFDGQVAVVTGAGAGLGRAYARLLAERGAKVLVNDYGAAPDGAGAGDPSAAEAVAAEIRSVGGIAAANADTVATADGADAIVAQALEHWGQVDILVNNAGYIAARTGIAQVTDEQWRADMAVAADGTFFTCRAVWDHMWERGYGRIVNTSSGSFFGMGTGVTPYPAAKAAVWGITKALAAHSAGAGQDVRVNCIMPTASGRMTSGMGATIAKLMARDFQPEKVAPLVALLCHAEAPSNGELFKAGGGTFSRVFAAVTPGYRAPTGVATVEEVCEHFDAVMATDGFVIPKHALDPAMSLFSHPEWQTFRGVAGHASAKA
jgi:NAD(P)-dependent dehydrogenase (short-subunit alcohol dehydrogenase family)